MSAETKPHTENVLLLPRDFRKNFRAMTQKAEEAFNETSDTPTESQLDLIENFSKKLKELLSPQNITIASSTLKECIKNGSENRHRRMSTIQQINEKSEDLYAETNQERQFPLLYLPNIIKGIKYAIAAIKHVQSFLQEEDDKIASTYIKKMEQRLNDFWIKMEAEGFDAVKQS